MPPHPRARGMDAVSWVTPTRHAAICGALATADARPGRAVCLQSHQARDGVGGSDAICTTCTHGHDTLAQAGGGEGEREGERDERERERERERECMYMHVCVCVCVCVCECVCVSE